MPDGPRETAQTLALLAKSGNLPNVEGIVGTLEQQTAEFTELLSSIVSRESAFIAPKVPQGLLPEIAAT